MELVLDGQRELIRSLRAVDRELPRELTPLHKQIAEPLAAYAEALAPKRSGRLAGSIRALAGQKYARVAAGKRAVPYAGPIHYGWPARNIEPHTFLTDALEANAEKTADRYHELLNEFLDQVWQQIG